MLLRSSVQMPWDAALFCRFRMPKSQYTCRLGLFAASATARAANLSEHRLRVTNMLTYPYTPA